MKNKHNKINKKKLSKSSKSLPLWNLGDLYPSITSDKIITDLDYIKKSSKAFERKYEGKIIKLSSLHLSKAIIYLEKIDEVMDKILSFAHLLVAENSDNEKNKIFFQQIQEKITNYSSC